MKTKILILLIFCVNTILAQDLMIFKNGDEKEVKILKISSSEITYKKWSNLKGPEYTMDISEIFMVKYKNGDKDIFNNIEKTSSQNLKSNNSNNKIKLPAGSSIQLYFLESISSKDLQAGQAIRLAVKNPIQTRDGKIIVNANTGVIGTITDVTAAKTGGQRGKLNFNVNSVTAVNGEKISVFYNINSKGEDKEDDAFFVGMFLFWPALFLKGGEANISAGTLINVQTTQNFYISMDELDNPNINILNNDNSSSENIIINTIQEPIIERNNPCGEKPIEPGRFNNPQYKQTKGYKKYKKDLREWKKCTGNN